MTVLSKSGREIVGYYIRQGEIPGQGRYLSSWDHSWLGDKPVSEDCRHRAKRFVPEHRQGAAVPLAEQFGGRVVAIVKKKATAGSSGTGRAAEVVRLLGETCNRLSAQVGDLTVRIAAAEKALRGER